MQQLLTLSTIFSISNVVVMSIVIAVLVRIFNTTRVNITLGLLTLSGFLLAENSIQLYSYVMMEKLFSAEVVPFLFAINLTQLAGSLVFFKIIFQ